jgi:predicted transposase
MLCTMKIKLITDAKQHRELLETMKRLNEACNEISRVAFENRTFSKVKIHKLCYYDIQEKFGLSAPKSQNPTKQIRNGYIPSKKQERFYTMIESFPSRLCSTLRS